MRKKLNWKIPETLLTCPALNFFAYALHTFPQLMFDLLRNILLGEGIGRNTAALADIDAEPQTQNYTDNQTKKQVFEIHSKISHAAMAPDDCCYTTNLIT
jgi:hypothetical protein